MLNTLKFVSEVFGASSQETVAVIEPGQYVRTDEGLCGFLGEVYYSSHEKFARRQGQYFRNTLNEAPWQITRPTRKIGSF